MKKYVFIMAMMLCALMSVNTVNAGNGKTSIARECECCKNCKDEKCKELCKTWCNMSAEAQQSEEGKKVKAECMKICEEKKCCSTSGKASCEGMEGKNCCKKK